MGIHATHIITQSHIKMTETFAGLSALTEIMKTLTKTIGELKDEIGGLREEMALFREGHSVLRGQQQNRKQSSRTGGGGGDVEVSAHPQKSSLQIRFEDYSSTLNPRQQATLRQSLRYWTAGVQREPISKEEAYELILIKEGIIKDKFETSLDSDSASRVVNLETGSVMSACVEAESSPDTDADRSDGGAMVAVASPTTRRITIPYSLTYHRHLKLLNGNVSFRPNFTFADFLRGIVLDFSHADIMIQDSYADGMAKVVYDVLKQQAANHDSACMPVVSLMTSCSNGKYNRALYQFVADVTEGGEMNIASATWKPLLAKDIEDCLNIFTRNMMFMSNEWRRKQMMDDMSPESLDRTMELVSHMNHIGRGRNSSLEGERKKIVAKLMELVEINL